MLRRTLLLASVVLSACAGPGANAPGLGPVTEKQKISNISYFVLATCAPREMSTPTPVNKEVLVGLLIAHRPEVMECLVDPNGRGDKAETTAIVESTVSETGATHKVTGDNLLPPAQSCIEGVLAKVSLPPLAKGAAPVAGRAEFHHNAVSPGVKLGLNDSSDIAGMIRLGEATWCDCYAGWAGKPPRTLKAKIKVEKDKPNSIEMEPTQDPAADAVGACLKGKLEAQKFAIKSNELTIVYPFVFLNSRVEEALATEAPDVQFIQMDSLRGQRSADTAIRVGARINAVTVYDAAVKKYQATKNFSLVKDLKAKCADLVKADDDWILAIETQAKLDRRTLQLANDLKAKDAKWSEAQVAAEKMVTGTDADVQTAQKTKAADLAVCPKEKK